MTGGFGTVRVARLGDETVAVKELRIAGGRKDRSHFAMRFARELKVWAPLDHPNLLKLSGFYLDPAMATALFVCPFYTHGHIRNFIEVNEPDEVMRLKLAEDTALGLRHLHMLQIAHGDLKDLNVLVDPEPRALLCDYGLSKMVNPDGGPSGLTTTGLHLSVRFASPEILNGLRPDLLSDMWAWGCVFLKARIVCDVEPFEGTTEMACMIRIVQGIPPADVSTLTMITILRHMLAQCWNLEPSARPNIEQCIQIIESVMPPKPEPLRSYLSTESMEILGTNCGYVHSVAFSPDGSLLACASNDGKVRMWDVKSNALVSTLECGVHVWAVAFSPNGKQLACGMGDAAITIWETIHRTPTPSSGSSTSWVQTIKLKTASAACSVAFSPDGSRFAAGLGLKDGKVQIWDKMDGDPVVTLESDGPETRGLTFSPDGKWLAFCSWNTASWIQDTLNDVPSATYSEWPPMVKLEGHFSEPGSVAFSPNGRWLASAGADGAITIRKVPSWTLFATLKTDDWIIFIAWSPDSTMITAGTIRGKVQLWDVESRRLLSSLQGHKNSVRGVAFSPDGKSTASGSLDGTVRLWKVMSSPAIDALVDPVA